MARIRLAYHNQNGHAPNHPPANATGEAQLIYGVPHPIRAHPLIQAPGNAPGNSHLQQSQEDRRNSAEIVREISSTNASDDQSEVYQDGYFPPTDDEPRDPDSASAEADQNSPPAENASETESAESEVQIVEEVKPIPTSSQSDADSRHLHGATAEAKKGHLMGAAAEAKKGHLMGAAAENVKGNLQGAAAIAHEQKLQREAQLIASQSKMDPSVEAEQGETVNAAADSQGTEASVEKVQEECEENKLAAREEVELPSEGDEGFDTLANPSILPLEQNAQEKPQAAMATNEGEMLPHSPAQQTKSRDETESIPKRDNEQETDDVPFKQAKYDENVNPESDGTAL